jgi:hypothetical protein
MHPARSCGGRTHDLGPSWRGLVLVIAVASLTAAAGARSTAIAATTAPKPSASSSPNSPTPSPSSTGKPATPDVTFGIGPTASVDANQRPYFSFGVTPGAQASDHVTLVNYSTTALSLSVYTVLANNGGDSGAIGFALATETPTDAASWLTVGAARPVAVTVPGRSNGASPPGQVTLPVQLKVPLNAQPGDHVAGIVAALNAASTSATGEHVNLEQRVVTRVYIRVSGPLKPNLEIVNLHASYHEKGYTLAPGSVLVTYTVRNAGNIRVAATQAVAVSGLFGGSKKVVPANIAQLLPGGEVKVAAVVAGVLPTVLIRPHVTVTPTAFPGDADPALKKLSAGAWTLAIPWGVLAIVALILTALWWRRRRTRPRLASVTQAVAAPGSGRHRVDAAQPSRSRHAR